jgi:hypothetical protein
MATGIEQRTVRGGRVMVDDQIDADTQALEQMSAAAIQQWQRAVGGLIAIPAAAALTTATAALYVGLFVEVGFDAFRRTATRVWERTAVSSSPNSGDRGRISTASSSEERRDEQLRA